MQEKNRLKVIVTNPKTKEEAKQMIKNLNEYLKEKYSNKKDSLVGQELVNQNEI
ncbi:MAG: hypothetical protein IJ568_05565 [Bacilli bacterium]|nr:hypothetical protein [Bacilli bacterium]